MQVRIRIDFLRIKIRKKQKSFLDFKMASKDELKTLTDSVLASRSNTKQIPDLIKALDDPALTKIALNSLLKVFTNLCQKGDFAVADDKNEAVKKYSNWLTDVFDETMSKIASIIASDKKQILKELCLTSMMKLIVKSHDPKEEKTWTSIDVKRFKLIIDALLNSEIFYQLYLFLFNFPPTKILIILDNFDIKI